MLITAFSTISTRRSPGASNWGWVPKPGRASSGDLVVLERGTFRFWFQRLNPLVHSPQCLLWRNRCWILLKNEWGKEELRKIWVWNECFFYIMWRFPSFSAMLYSNQNLCLTLQALNLNLYCNSERVCTGKVLAFRSGKVPTLNFWKVHTCQPWAIVFRSNYLCWHQQKLKRLISQQEKVLWRRSTPLWNSETKMIIVRYPSIQLCTYA